MGALVNTVGNISTNLTQTGFQPKVGQLQSKMQLVEESFSLKNLALTGGLASYQFIGAASGIKLGMNGSLVPIGGLLVAGIGPLM